MLSSLVLIKRFSAYFYHLARIILTFISRQLFRPLPLVRAYAILMLEFATNEDYPKIVWYINSLPA